MTPNEEALLKDYCIHLTEVISFDVNNFLLDKAIERTEELLHTLKRLNGDN